MTKEDVYGDVKAYFSKILDVDVSEGRGGLGLKFNNKMFVMFFKSSLIVKFSKERVNELIASREGTAHDPGTGTPMKDRILITKSEKLKWIEYCIESKEHVDPNS